MKASKKPLRVKETIVLPKRTVCWVTVETGEREGNLILPSGPGKGRLLHIEHGRVEIPMLNNKDEDQQLIKGTKDWEDLLVRLKQVLMLSELYGLTLKLSKCVFGCDELDYLEFKIVKGYLQLGEVKQQAKLDVSTPTDVHSVKRFLGLTGIFRRFIPHYALKAEPLTSLTKKDTKFIWGEEQQEAFDQL
ncbi:uncharacterized protein [Dermacentor andersoni]|uniref:uncharacterized protein n=1 Tax=Dermacentor andersoni TaxID=34620 RepID=UPI003B3AC2B9